MKLQFVRALLVTCGLLALTGVQAQADASPPSPPLVDLSTLKAAHPRLLANEHTWSNLKNRRAHDPKLDAILKSVESDAIKILGEKPLVYKKQGKRLLSVSREAIRRILALALTAQTTKGERAPFIHRAETELVNLSQFNDWNPSHFLDVGEMTTALAFGYDWLFDDLSSDSRLKIRTAILEKGLKAGDDPKLPNTSWYHQEMNWNQVCFGGLALGALAIAETKPKDESLVNEAAKVLSQVKANISHGLKPYAPNGVDPEGPNYWGYGTMYQVLLNESLKSALGTDWNLSRAKGFAETGDYLVAVTGPTLKYFNYSDGGENASLQPALYALAKERRDLLFFQDQLLEKELARSQKDRFFPLIVLFADSFAPAPKPKTPLHYQGEGEQPLAIFRSDWSPSAFYLAAKGGSASLNHAHLDAGSFVLDRDGIRWFSDLGSQDYDSLESKRVDLWNRKQDSQRWDVFRISALSHSVFTIDGRRPRVDGHARLTQMDETSATFDLSEVYSGQALQAVRTFKRIGERNVSITDRITGLKPGQRVLWTFTTFANVFSKNSDATLSLGGKALVFRATCPSRCAWKTTPADPPPRPFDAPNPGVSLLHLEQTAGSDGVVDVTFMTE